jgi:mannosyltransferase OCH1-like enzyme
MIPHLLHQTWKNRTPPEPLALWSATWKQRNPELAYRLWDDHACRELVRADFPHYLALYDGMPFAVQRADFFRYLVVYRFGGLYADMDMECLRPVKTFLESEGALFTIEAQVTKRRQHELGYRNPYQIANCIFAAIPGHPFLRLVIEQAAALVRSGPARDQAAVLDSTGPHMLTRVFYHHAPADVQVLEQIYWMAPTRYPNWFPINRNMYARHMCYGSWRAVRDAKSLRRRWIERDIMPKMFPRAPLRVGLAE